MLLRKSRKILSIPTAVKGDEAPKNSKKKMKRMTRKTSQTIQIKKKWTRKKNLK